MRRLALALTLLLGIQLTGCGLLMHPERKGLRDGDIDAGVAILDGLGLIFFIIPGVIAYAVDFSNGTIYLPHGHRHRIVFPEHASVREVQGQIEATVARDTGVHARLDAPDVKAIELDSIDELQSRLAQADALACALQPGGARVAAR